MESPPSSDSNHINKSHVSHWDSVILIISIEFYGHTNCHKNCNYFNVTNVLAYARIDYIFFIIIFLNLKNSKQINT